MSNLFGGGKPKKPVMEKVTPIEKVVQGDVEKEKIMRELAKRKRATMLAHITEPAKVKRQTLGAA